MFWRTVLALHLLPATLHLARTNCMRTVVFPCSASLPRPLLVPLFLATLCLTFALGPARNAVRELSQGSVTTLRFARAVIPVLWDIWKDTGTGPRVHGLESASLATLCTAPVAGVQLMPGSWRWESWFDNTTMWRRFADDETDIPSAASNTANISVDASAFPDTLTLHASDIALLGRHLARAHGMFAWRVYPVTHLSRDPYTHEPAVVLLQRIDAFLKPAGHVVHYVEFLVEWVPSSRSDCSFLVLEHTPEGPRLVGTRVHAFRARKCDPLMCSKAEFLLNTLGLGCHWACSWNWDTLLGKSFDGPRYARYAQKDAIVERWDADVRTHWARAGRQPSEVEAMAKDILEFSWAADAEDDSDDDDGDWTDDEDWDSSSEDDGYGSGLDEDEQDDNDKDFPSAAEPRPVPTSSGGPRDVSEGPQYANLSGKRRTTCVEVDDESDRDEVVYPRHAAPVESDDEELILYNIPRRRSTLHSSTPQASYNPPRTINAPTPVYTTAPYSKSRTSFTTRVADSLGFGGALRAFQLSTSAPLFIPNKRVLEGVTIDTVYDAPSRPPRAVGLSYAVVLERVAGTAAGMRAVIQVESHAPAPAAVDMAELEPEPESEPQKKKTRRAGRRITARRQRQRVANVGVVARLAAELRVEAEATVREEGMDLVEVVVYLDKQAPARAA